ncbi:22459_t:CDS:2, partial [Dentiscutata erythropus]
SRAVWYGFQGDVKEVAIFAVNAIQGTIGDILLFRRITEPFKLLVICTMVQNASDMLVKEIFSWLNNEKVDKDDIDPRTKDKQISQLWKVEFFRDNNYRLRSFVSGPAQRMYCIGEDLHMWDFVNYFWNLEKIDFIDE